MFELKKIGFVKRASALLLDAILLAVLTTGFMFILSLICDYRGQSEKASNYLNQWEDYRIEYISDIAKNYGFTYTESDDGSYAFKKGTEDSSIDEVLDALVKDEARQGRMEEAYAAYKKLPSVSVVNSQYEYVYTMLFMIISIGVLLAYLVLEFVLPIILKNGRTVGKKVFGICLVQPNCVKVSKLQLFARTILGKFAIETMFPILLVFLFLFGGIGWLAIILFVAITLLNIILFIVTKNKTPIHDMIAGTVTVDMSLQMIYQSEQDLVEKKSILHSESVLDSKS